jgi:hypothetical protein
VSTNPTQLQQGLKNAVSEEALYKLDYFDSEGRGEIRYAYLGKMHPFPLLVLDLCVFNADGTAKIAVGGDPPDGLIGPWQHRYQVVQNHFSESFGFFAEIQDGYLSRQGLSQKVRREKTLSLTRHALPGLMDGPFSATIDTASHTISYDIQRVMRLTQPKGADALTKLWAYSSRAAFEHDYAIALEG